MNVFDYGKKNSLVKHKLSPQSLKVNLSLQCRLFQPVSKEKSNLFAEFEEISVSVSRKKKV